MQETDRHPQLELPEPPIKGRGAAGNVAHRFATATRRGEDDGWWQDQAEAPRTELLPDASKSVISHNDSPDLGFSQALNPYRGCEHGCIYCYARPTHAWLGLSPGLDFETRIFYKADVARLLKAELAKPGYECQTLVLGSATDAYQPAERKLGLTRAVLEVLLACRHPVGIVSKSALITRDLDLWAALAAEGLGHVAFSLTSLDPAPSRRLEPRSSTPVARLEAMAKLAGAGVPVSVFVAPLIPGLNDHEMEKLLAAARDHGATSASWTLLRLPHEVAGLFEQWLAHHAPLQAARIMAVLYDLRGGRVNDARFGSRMTGLGHFADLLAQRFALTCRKLDLATDLPRLDCSRFTPPRELSEESSTRQLSLF